MNRGLELAVDVEHIMRLGGWESLDMVVIKLSNIIDRGFDKLSSYETVRLEYLLNPMS